MAGHPHADEIWGEDFGGKRRDGTRGEEPMESVNFERRDDESGKRSGPII